MPVPADARRRTRNRRFATGAVVLGIAALAVYAIANGVGDLIRGTCACGDTVIWTVAALDADHVLAFGGTGGPNLDQHLVVLRTSDGGTTWSRDEPNVPAMTVVALAGNRIYGSVACLPQYPPDYNVPSGADMQFGPGVDRSLHPAPASCLYASDDAGRSWYDVGTGQLADPTFADAANGWAHSPYDPVGQSSTTLYSTVDGGRTWQVEPAPCDPATPFIGYAFATGPRTGYVLCVGPDTDGGETPPKLRDWEIVQVRTGASPVIRLGSSTSTMSNTGVSGFFMRADGIGWITLSHPSQGTDGITQWTTAVYRTTDGGETWTSGGPIDLSHSGANGATFVTPMMGFRAFRSTGAMSGVEVTLDAGVTWRTVAAWDWWEFKRIQP